MGGLSCSYLGERDVLWVSDDAAVGLLIAGVIEELRTPHSEIGSAWNPLWEKCDGRP